MLEAKCQVPSYNISLFLSACHCICGSDSGFDYLSFLCIHLQLHGNFGLVINTIKSIVFSNKHTTDPENLQWKKKNEKINGLGLK
jgi:hypothetical protein